MMMHSIAVAGSTILVGLSGSHVLASFPKSHFFHSYHIHTLPCNKWLPKKFMNMTLVLARPLRLWRQMIRARRTPSPVTHAPLWKVTGLEDPRWQRLPLRRP
ncbi:hypothetical protein PHLGIDRAFT_199515 [Phlebiopsis gigantea 11061_1 CR5-6]|uniref:Uncharacterized protein n=1 Tax=Phlebiopsis gigantea (strain 11061_1 CR5-6) TaxID=745531 RepID=A0A0C3NHQ2_PHLG1|nr:hypothetical protein PHLGIDRAFT_199515 [Phlebiopsis gigantea 11061_1 CR5-6]